DLLRRGESGEYEKLIREETSPERQRVVITNTVTLGRQWLSTKRDTFLKNAAPLLVRAALLHPNERELRLLALNVLEYLASGLSEDQLEAVINIEDVMRLDETASTQQKRRVIGNLVGFFQPSVRG